jgi:RNA polymerase sigma-70 factor (ECF subfamily)
VRPLSVQFCDTESPVKALVPSETVEQCRVGDRDAFHALFEAYRERVYGIAWYFVSDENAAKDVTQEVFLKLLMHLKEFRADSSFDTWLYRLVVNCCMDEHRRRRRIVPLLIDSRTQPAEPGQVLESTYARKEVAAAVQAAVRKLKPKLRIPVVLRYAEELSYGEIATVLGCSEGTIASRLNRAHRALTRKLGYLVGSNTAGRRSCDPGI